MIKTGRLTIAAGLSRLDGTRLMRGALNNGGFGRATNFLQQERQLQSGETIFVDGVEREFQQDDVIVISDAGRETQESLAMAAEATPLGLGGSKAARKTTSTKKRAQRTGSKKKARRPPAKKSAAKKSAAKKSAAKKSAAAKRGRKSASKKKSS